MRRSWLLAVLGCAFALPAWAESGKFNLNVDLGAAGTFTGRYGTQADSGGLGQTWGPQLTAGIDYQIAPPLAFELAGGFGMSILPPRISLSEGGPYLYRPVPMWFVGIGPRLRLMEDFSGYTDDENASPRSHVFAALHVGVHGYDGVQVGLDATLGYLFNRSRPINLGPFVRGMLLLDNGASKGHTFILAFGLAATFELSRLERSAMAASGGDPDGDRDGLIDATEIPQYQTDPQNPDTDGDGLKDGLEVQSGTNPTNRDTDGDGTADGIEDANQNGRIDPGETDPRHPPEKPAPAAAAPAPAPAPVPAPAPAPVEPPPAAPAPVAAKDSDKDGVADEADKCPGTAAGLSVDAKGCVEIKKEFVLEGVTFASGSANILPQSAKVLEQAAQVFKENADIEVEVGGYTDNQGNAANNEKLSLARAEAVKAWMVKKGIAAKRFTTKGYGPAKPRATNDTNEGRAKNRRIEFTRTDPGAQ